MNPLRRAPASSEELEEGLRNLARTVHAVPALNNADNMHKAQQIINNGLTAAHRDTIKVMHALRDECHALVARVDKLVDEHEAMLNSKGNEIAIVLESAMNELKRSVAWFEEQMPRLADPKLELPAPPKPDVDASAAS